MKHILLAPFTPKSIILLQFFRKNNVEISGFIDNSAKLQEDSYSGVRIISPQKSYELFPNSLVILCSPQHNYSLLHQLEKIGFSQFLQFQDVITYPDAIEAINQIDFTLLSQNYPTLSNSFFVGNCRQSINDFAIDLRGIAYREKELCSNCGEREVCEVRFLKPYEYDDAFGRLRHSHKEVDFLVLINATGVFEESLLKVSVDNAIALKYASKRIAVVVTNEHLERVQDVLDEKEKFEIICTDKQCLSNLELLKTLNQMDTEFDEVKYLITLSCGDTLDPYALAIICHKLALDCFVVATLNEDRIYGEEFIAPYYKEDYQKYCSISVDTLLRRSIVVPPELLFILSNEMVKAANIIVVDGPPLYHFRVQEGYGYDNKIKPIAFYLPQFHTIPENDAWWGKGFTEWTNVRKALPMFTGHYQPHKPERLGYYDLANDSDIQKKQQDLAKSFGIYGFCYYYYWFDGKRLLEKPLDNVLENKELDMPFCICWANESWSRRWDGSEKEILIQQVHNSDSDLRFITDIMPILSDSRYIRVNGAPLLLIYRADLFDNMGETARLWRNECQKHGLSDIHIAMVQSFGSVSPEYFGCDSSVEFPPHNNYAANIKTGIADINPEYNGRIKDYRDLSHTFMNKRRCYYKYFRGIMLGWDNTARRGTESNIYYNFSIKEYKKWLMTLTDFISREPEGERLVFINAWNEWAEGTHLEPDMQYGLDYLEATKEGISINCD